MVRDGASMAQRTQSGEKTAWRQSGRFGGGRAAPVQSGRSSGDEAAPVQNGQSGGDEAVPVQSGQSGGDDAVLMQSVQNGSEEALTCLIERHYHAIYAYFYKNTGQYHRSLDLTQEVFMKAAAAIGRYRPSASFQSWLFKIASNHLKNYYRSLSRRPREQELSEGTAEAFVRERADPSAESAAEESAVEQKSDLASALAKLPAAQKEAVLLRFYHDFSVKEIAKITHAPQTTVKARIRYGLAKLKKELGGSYETNNE